jgi:hypothetical protein
MKIPFGQVNGLFLFKTASMESNNARGGWLVAAGSYQASFAKSRQ